MFYFKWNWMKYVFKMSDTHKHSLYLLVKVSIIWMVLGKNPLNLWFFFLNKLPHRYAQTFTSGNANLFIVTVHYSSMLTLIFRKKLSSHLNTNGLVCWSNVVILGTECRSLGSVDILPVSILLFRYLFSLLCELFLVNNEPFLAISKEKKAEKTWVYFHLTW